MLSAVIGREGKRWKMRIAVCARETDIFAWRGKMSAALIPPMYSGHSSSCVHGCVSVSLTIQGFSCIKLSFSNPPRLLFVSVLKRRPVWFCSWICSIPACDISVTLSCEALSLCFRKVFKCFFLPLLVFARSPSVEISVFPSGSKRLIHVVVTFYLLTGPPDQTSVNDAHELILQTLYVKHNIIYVNFLDWYVIRGLKPRMSLKKFYSC